MTHFARLYERINEKKNCVALWAFISSSSLIVIAYWLWAFCVLFWHRASESANALCSASNVVAAHCKVIWLGCKISSLSRCRQEASPITVHKNYKSPLVNEERNQFVRGFFFAIQIKIFESKFCKKWKISQNFTFVD